VCDEGGGEKKPTIHEEKQKKKETLQSRRRIFGLISNSFRPGHVISPSRALKTKREKIVFFKKISPPPSCLFIFLFLFDHVVSPIIFPF
jgi:hypothetical protein